MLNIEEIEKINIENLSDVELDKLLKYSEKRADQECYNVGINYNIRDVELVERLNDKLKLIELSISLTYQAKIRHEDHFYQVRMWDTLIYNKLLQDNVVVPPMSQGEKSEKYTGAVVFDPQVGMHEWIVSFDLASLYPSLMRQYNISPEMLITRQDLEAHGGLHSNVLLSHFHPERDKLLIKVEDLLTGQHTEIQDAIHELDLSLTANGVLYSKKKQGFLAQLMEEIYNKRKEMKNHMLDAEKRYEESKDIKDSNDIAMYKSMQMSYKTLLNSCYGALGNEFGRFYNVDMAESITISGQLSIQWIERIINTHLNKLFKTDNVNYTVAGDTDSNYFTFKPFVDMVVGDKKVDKHKIVDLIDEFCNKNIQPVINKGYDELKEYMNAFQQQMFMDREVIADRGFWRAKKNYALNVYDSEGVRYKEPKLKIMGIEAIKSSTPALCRDSLKEGIRMVLQENETVFQKWVKVFKKEFNREDIDLISSPSGISDLNKWYQKEGFKKGTPFHVKGALTYNRLLKEYNLLGKYREIKNGDKIKCYYLKKQNPLFSNAIAWPDVLPEEFGLDKYLDHDIQYQKSFVNPMESITNSIGWQLEKKSTLF